jgi:hypothetical protein
MPAHSDTDDLVTITRLILHERQGRDRGWWQQMRETLAVDTRIHLSRFHGSGAEFITASQNCATNSTAYCPPRSATVPVPASGARNTRRVGPCPGLPRPFDIGPVMSDHGPAASIHDPGRTGGSWPRRT